MFKKADLDRKDIEENKIFSMNDFFGWKTQAKENIKGSIFNSDFTAKELRLLDLKANSDLYPELVNRDTDVRKRQKRTFDRNEKNGRFAKRQKTNTGETSAGTADPDDNFVSNEDMFVSINEKAKIFQGITAAAEKQATIYSDAAAQLKF